LGLGRDSKVAPSPPPVPRARRTAVSPPPPTSAAPAAAAAAAAAALTAEGQDEKVDLDTRFAAAATPEESQEDAMDEQDAQLVRTRR
jgi:hypothetical protein